MNCSMASNLLILRSKDILGMCHIFRNMRFRNLLEINASSLIRAAVLTKCSKVLPH